MVIVGSRYEADSAAYSGVWTHVRAEGEDCFELLVLFLLLFICFPSLFLFLPYILPILFPFFLTFSIDGFGGLVVSMRASDTQVCGFKTGRSRWIFTGVKILSMPSSGGEVKESVPCPSFAACKRT